MNILIFSDLQTHNYREFSFITEKEINSRLQNCLDIFGMISSRVHASTSLGSKDPTENINNNKENKIKKIYFLGDLFNLKNNVDSQVIKLTLRNLILAANTVEKLIIVPGNHDYRLWASEPALLEIAQEFSENKIQLIDKPTLLKEERLYIEPYSRRISEVNERLKNIAIENDYVFLGHQDINGISYGGAPVTNGLDADFLSKKFKFSFIGHYHNPAVVRKNVISVGAPLQNSFSDLGTQKGWWIFDGNETKFEENTISPIFKEISIKSEDEIIAVDEKNFYRVKISGTTLPKGIERLTFRRPMFIRQEIRRGRSEIQFSDSIETVLKKYIDGQKSNLDGEKLFNIGIECFKQ